MFRSCDLGAFSECLWLEIKCQHYSRTSERVKWVLKQLIENGDSDFMVATTTIFTFMAPEDSLGNYIEHKTTKSTNKTRSELHSELTSCGTAKDESETRRERERFSVLYFDR